MQFQFYLYMCKVRGQVAAVFQENRLKTRFLFVMSFTDEDKFCFFRPERILKMDLVLLAREDGKVIDPVQGQSQYFTIICMWIEKNNWKPELDSSTPLQDSSP